MIYYPDMGMEFMKLTNQLILILFIFSCGENNLNQKLVIVNGIDIKLHDYQLRYENYIDELGLTDNYLIRKEFLEGFIFNKLLLNEFDKLKMGDNPQINQTVESIKNQKILNEYYKNEVYDKIIIDESEIRHAFKMSNTQIHVRHLYSKNLELSNSYYQRLKNGESFENLAKEVFQDSKLKNNGGDLGYFTFNEMDIEFEKVAFSLENGEISMPVKTLQGYSIIQVLDRWIEPFLTETDFQMKKEDLYHILKRRKRKVALLDYTETLKSKINIDVNNKELQNIFNNWESIKDGEIKFSEIIPNKFENFNISEISEKQINRVKNIEDIKELILGIALREKILSKAKNTEWINSENFKQIVRIELEGYKLKQVIKFHLGNREITKLALDSLEEKLKSESKIIINKELLKDFILG